MPKAREPRFGPPRPPRPARGPRRNLEKKLALRAKLEGRLPEPKELAEERELPQEPRAAIAVEEKPAPVTPGLLTLPKTIVVSELAGRLGVGPVDVLKELVKMGVMVSINQSVDFETATLVASEFGIETRSEEELAPAPAQEAVEAPPVITKEALWEEEDPKVLRPRAPVVTVLGHVDHGKTSLLDAIRLTNVTAREAGGITQHIGAYQVEKSGRKVTFLDTPGHEAFTAMRARGAKVTDVAVLVVAADDGVQPQTVEAIAHARAAAVPIVVALNKVDKPDANPEQVKQQLAEQGVQIEEYGGDVPLVAVSAKTKQGIEDLLDVILLVADIQNLKANPERAAIGTVIEAHLDKGRGSVATVLVQTGSLERGDIVVAGKAWGKVRAMIDDKGKKIGRAEPARPVEILGLPEVPEPGDVFRVVADEKTARAMAQAVERHRAQQATAEAPPSLEDLFARVREGKAKELRLVLKADVQGSLEAIRGALQKLPQEPVGMHFVHAGVGDVSESDVNLAAAAGAVVIGFSNKVDVAAKRVADALRVDVRTYKVIYELLDDVQRALTGMLEPEMIETVLGHAELRALFRAGKVTIAGCYVSDGVVQRGASARLLRGGNVVYDGKVATLRRVKEDVREVRGGLECGMTLENHNDVQTGDVIEVYTVQPKPRG